MGKGIDYGMGMANICKKTGNRFGVIPQSAILQAWCDSSEPVYPEPESTSCECETCGGSGNIDDSDTIAETGGREGYNSSECPDCDGSGMIEEEDCCDEPIGFVYRGEGIFAHCGECGDIFIESSPFFTLARFCSPCAPGAGYLLSPDSDGAPTFCFPSDWFDSDSPCPYPIWRVDTCELIYVPKGWYREDDGSGQVCCLKNP